MPNHIQVIVQCSWCVFNKFPTTKDGLHPSQSLPSSLETGE